MHWYGVLSVILKFKSDCQDGKGHALLYDPGCVVSLPSNEIARKALVQFINKTCTLPGNARVRRTIFSNCQWGITIPFDKSGTKDTAK